MANKLPEYFDPIAGQINVRLLATKRVAVIGLGAVGSPIAADLAKHGVGSFLLIDGDVYEERNRSRHPLPPNYRGENKATAVRQHLLSLQVPVSKDVKALPRYVDESMTDNELDALLDPADLIVAATGEREVQQRIARRALALDIPVVLPSLYAGGGGEVFIQTSPRRPCFFCLDGFRLSTEPVRGAEALAVDLTAVIATAIELSYRVLDPDSRYGGMTTPKHDEADQRPYQHFVLLREAPRRRFAISRQEDCPSCAVGPSPLRPEAGQAWQAAQQARAASAPAPTGAQPQPPPRPAGGSPPTHTPQPATIRDGFSPGRFLGVVCGLAIFIVAIIGLTKLGHSSAGNQGTQSANTPTTTQSAPVAAPQPKPAPLPARASENYDVAPTFASAGSLSEEEHPDGTVLRHLTLNAELKGPLLKVMVNSDYTPANASTEIAYAKEHDAPASLAQIVGRTCAQVTLWNSAHEDERHELTPVRTHLQQHGLDVSGTLLYPAVLPGEYEWGCEEPYRLGNLTTPNLGDAEGDVVFKLHRAATDTIVVIGLHGSTNVNEYDYRRAIREACIVPSEYGKPHYRPSHVTTYQTWAPGNGPPYIIAGLTFPIGTAHIEGDNFYPGCNPNSEEGVTLTSSSTAAPSYEFKEEDPSS
jgi:hypothetical protein